MFMCIYLFIVDFVHLVQREWPQGCAQAHQSVPADRGRETRTAETGPHQATGDAARLSPCHSKRLV